MSEKWSCIYISYDKKACALILYPEKKKGNFEKDLGLILKSIGLQNVLKVVKRERLLKEHHPEGLFYHLWFIGVYPELQNKGIGSKFLEEVLIKCDENKRVIYLETSVMRNIPWYQRYGFKVYNKLKIDYTLYQMIRS